MRFWYSCALGLKSSDGEVYTYNPKTRYFNSSTGAVIGGIQSNANIFIANAYRYQSNILHLVGTIGHELIHSYHEMKFGSNFRSQFSAYSYSVDFFRNNNLNSNDIAGYIQQRNSYTPNPLYDYKLTPGF